MRLATHVTSLMDIGMINRWSRQPCMLLGRLSLVKLTAASANHITLAKQLIRPADLGHLTHLNQSQSPKLKRRIFCTISKQPAEILLHMKQVGLSSHCVISLPSSAHWKGSLAYTRKALFQWNSPTWVDDDDNDTNIQLLRNWVISALYKWIYLSV